MSAREAYPRSFKSIAHFVPIALLWWWFVELSWDENSLRNFQVAATLSSRRKVPSLVETTSTSSSDSVNGRTPSSSANITNGTTTTTPQSSSSSSSYAALVQEVIKVHPQCQGKERLVEILLKAGKTEIIKSDCEDLPTWEQVSALYGDEPIVLGLDRCASYRASLLKRKTNDTTHSSDAEEEDSSFSLWKPQPRIGALFNTGTNALTESLSLNFGDVPNHRYYNLPGGKHTNLRLRKWATPLDGKSTRNNGNDQQNIEQEHSGAPFLPIILIRDPFRWMLSMCKSPYIVKWERGASGRCPNLVPDAFERRNLTDLYPQYNNNFSTFHVQVDRREEDGPEAPAEYYDSLADMWSDWYLQFLNAEFPRLIIRFEDTLFHAEKVMELIMDCVGRPMQEPYKYRLQNSKGRRRSSGFVTVLVKNGSERGRYNGLLPNDREYAQTALDSTLMKTFHYTQAPLRLDSDYRLEEEQMPGMEN